MPPGTEGRDTSGLVLDRDPVLAEMVRRLIEALRPDRIYLFGSRARRCHG